MFDSRWLERVTGGSWQGPPRQTIQRICHDTRTLMAGDLYVALLGESLDGHRYVAQAFEKGAAAAMVNKGQEAILSGRHGGLLVVEDTLEALWAMAGAHRHRQQALILGITGSAGKTTAKTLCAQVLKEKSRTVSTRGNWNNHIGLPMSLLELLPECRFGVFEAGMSHPGEIGMLAGLLSPDWGIVTTIGPAHLEFFGSIDAIADEKADLLRALPQDGVAFLNADDPYFDYLAGSVPCELRTLSFRKGVADLWLDVEHASKGHLRLETREGEHFLMPVMSEGRHMLVNMGLAILVGKEAGMDWSEIATGLKDPLRLPMRWEHLSVDGLLVINDAYNANPMSMEAAIRTFAQAANEATTGQWLVLGDMLELGDIAESAHEKIGQLVCETQPWAGVVCVGDLARLIIDGIKAGGGDGIPVWHCDSAEAAGMLLASETDPGARVLLKASRGIHLEAVVEVLKSGKERKS